MTRIAAHECAVLEPRKFPEALLHAISGGGGADAGAAAAPAADPAAGAPPMDAPKMAAAKDLRAIGQAVVNFKRAGRFQVKEARTKQIGRAHV